MSATYYIGAQEQTFLRRCLRSNTVRLAWASFAAFVANEIATKGLMAISPQAVIVAGIGAAIVTALRDTSARSELASNAANPNVSTVVAVPKETK